MKRILFALTLALTAVTTAAAQPNVVFEQITQEMGTLLWHNPKTVTFKISNKGTSELLIKDVRTDCGCTASDWTRTPIEPGASGTISATYDAELLGHFNKSLAVYTNLDDKPHYLNIVGEVSLTQREMNAEEYPYQIGNYYLSTDDIEFDDVNRGDTPTYTLYIFNAGKKSYRPELMHLPKYLTAQADPAVIRPGRVGRMLITLNSQELRNMGLTQTSIYLSRFMGDRVNKDTEINVSATLLPEFSENAYLDDNAPVAQIDSTTITLIPQGSKQKASGQIILKNTGKSPLTINALQVYNPGISVSLSKRTLKPGDTEKLKISVNATNTFFKGRRRVLLITNDPKHPKVVIDVIVKK